MKRVVFVFLLLVNGLAFTDDSIDFVIECIKAQDHGGTSAEVKACKSINNKFSLMCVKAQDYAGFPGEISACSTIKTKLALKCVRSKTYAGTSSQIKDCGNKYPLGKEVHIHNDDSSSIKDVVIVNPTIVKVEAKQVRRLGIPGAGYVRLKFGKYDEVVWQSSIIGGKSNLEKAKKEAKWLETRLKAAKMAKKLVKVDFNESGNGLLTFVDKPVSDEVKKCQQRNAELESLFAEFTSLGVNNSSLNSIKKIQEKIKVIRENSASVNPE